MRVHFPIWAVVAFSATVLWSASILAQGRWGQQAEENFWLGRGMGQQLMTQEEWREHLQKMQSMTAEERQSYREEWHRKMFERARERGVTTPGGPGPFHGGGPRSGVGPGGGIGGGGGVSPRGGMGSGGGMGPGGRR